MQIKGTEPFSPHLQIVQNNEKGIKEIKTLKIEEKKKESKDKKKCLFIQFLSSILS
jgi:hypothetical protein